MGAAKEVKQKQAPEFRAGGAVAGYLPWLGTLIRGVRAFGAVNVEGFSANFSGTGWLVVVRGFHVEHFRFVVVFGAGPLLYDALKNAGLAIAKSQWKNDHFKSVDT